MNRTSIIGIAVGVMIGLVFWYGNRTAIYRDAPSPQQATQFLQSLLQQEVTLYDRHARVDLVGPDGEAVEGHPSLLGAVTPLGCPLNNPDGRQTQTRYVQTYYDSEYTCLYAIEGPENLRFHIAAYVTREEDPSLRFRVNGYGFRLQSAERTSEMMQEIGVASTPFTATARRALWDQLDRLGFYVPADPDRTTPTFNVLEHL